MSRTPEQIDATRAVLDRAQAEGRIATLEETYPEQYENPLVGDEIVYFSAGQEQARGKALRVLPSGFGQLVVIEGHKGFYPLSGCRTVTELETVQ